MDSSAPLLLQIPLGTVANYTGHSLAALSYQDMQALFSAHIAHDCHVCMLL